MNVHGHLNPILDAFRTQRLTAISPNLASSFYPAPGAHAQAASRIPRCCPVRSSPSPSPSSSSISFAIGAFWHPMPRSLPLFPLPPSILQPEGRRMPERDMCSALQPAMPPHLLLLCLPSARVNVQPCSDPARSAVAEDSPGRADYSCSEVELEGRRLDLDWTVGSEGGREVQ